MSTSPVDLSDSIAFAPTEYLNIGLWQLRRRAAADDPYAQAVLDWLRRLDQQLAADQQRILELERLAADINTAWHGDRQRLAAYAATPDRSSPGRGTAIMTDTYGNELRTKWLEASALADAAWAEYITARHYEADTWHAYRNACDPPAAQSTAAGSAPAA